MEDQDFISSSLDLLDRERSVYITPDTRNGGSVDDLTAWTFSEDGLPYDTSQTGQNNVHKEDNELFHDDGSSSRRSLRLSDTISITIVDSEGPLTYFRKSYKLGIKTNMKKALDQIRSHVCTTCSDPQMLEFWYETTQLENGQTAALLSMEEGDTIDIRLKQACTRGAHPLPASQTTPNMHYLDVGVFAALAEDTQPPMQKQTVNLTFRNDTRFSMTFRLRVDQPIRKACEAFEMRSGSLVGTCRFHSEGERIDRTKTPRELELEDSDIIEAYTEILGGGGPAATSFSQRQRSNHNATEENFNNHLLKPLPSKPLPSTPGPAEKDENDDDEIEVEITSQTTLIFIDEYAHRLPVTISSVRPLLQALEYAAFRMGKNATNLAFEIQGTRIDLDVLGSKTALDLGIEEEVEVKVWWALLPPGLRKEPDDELVPRSVRLGERPPVNYVRSTRD